MLLTLFGSPSALSYALSRIIRIISANVAPAYNFIQSMYIDDFVNSFRELSSDERKFVVFFSDCPHYELTALFSRAGAPIIISVERFDDIIRYLIKARGMDMAHAIRFGTQVACALSALNSVPNVVRISPADYGRSLRATVEALIQFYSIPCDALQFDAIMRDLSLGPTDRPPTLRDYIEEHFPHFLGEPEVSGDQLHGDETLRRIARDYARLVVGGEFTAAEWPTELFLKWDTPGAFLDGPIELVGPGRFIICGPYLHLPVGPWRMDVEIKTEDCLSDNRLGADVFSRQILTAGTMKLPSSGMYNFSLDFDVTDPFDPVELRVQLLTGAIEGRLSLLAVRLTRRGSSTDHSEPNLSARATENVAPR